MKRLDNLKEQIRLTFSKRGIAYLFSRVPSVLFWSTISTGLLIGGQYLYFNVLPANYFFNYQNPAKISNVELGVTPTLEYCRTSRGDYPIVVNAQIRKVEPPVYVQQYQVDTNLPQGSGCIEREIQERPSVPGEYKIFYSVEVELPFGVKKYARFETNAFKVAVPDNVYGDYELTINDLDDENDGKPVYSAGNNLEYRFKGNLLVETFGTTERHLVCGDDDYFIDSYSGRNTAGEKDSLNKTVNIPENVKGDCHLELRLAVTVAGSTSVVTQTLTSNTFVVR